MPNQSNSLPMISLFFLLSLSFTFLAFVWFAIINEMKTKKYLPKKLNYILSKLRRKGNKVESCINLNDCIEYNISVLNKIAFVFISVLMTFSYLFIWICIASL